MTQTNNPTNQPIQVAQLAKRMIIGGAIALLLISLFLFSDDNPNPDWPEFWIVKPLVMVPIAGALGGAFYYFVSGIRYLGGWKTIVGYLISIIGYMVILWLGSVLGLNGTYWD